MDSYAERHGHRITYQDLAERTGIAKATLEAIGSRPNYNPTLSTIDTLCRCLECSVGELLEYSSSDR